MNIKSILAAAAVATAVMGISSCTEKKFHVEGTITGAKDSTLYFENMSLSGPVALDSVKLGDDGTFSFAAATGGAPEFYRLRIAGQIINIAADSTETIGIKAQYPAMATDYEVTGSDDCATIKKLALMQMGLQAQVNAIAQSPALGVDAVADSIDVVVERYKNEVKLNYIFKEPMKASSYFALFQTISLGNMSSLIFNPRNSEEDVKVFAAVATSWDTYFPKAERGENLHNIALEGMKNVRIIRSKQAQSIDPSKVSTTGIIDITLPDNHGNMRSLSQLKGKVEVINAEKSVNRHGLPSMEITFRLLSTINTSSMCDQYGQLWIFGVGQTENGVDVKELLPNYREWRPNDSDGREFKNFLESEPGETITFEFTGDNELSNDVNTDLEKVKKFKLNFKD